MAVKVRGGVALGYQDEGHGDPALVLIHGWTCNRTFFRAQQLYFSARHRVVSVDLAGHGESDQPQGDFTVRGFAEDVAWLIGELGLDRPILVGHSLGGLVALETAVGFPHLVRAIVMLDPAPLTKPPPLRAALQAVIDSIAAGSDEARRRFIGSMFTPATPAPLRESLTKDMSSAPAAVAVGAMRAVLEYDGVAAAGRVGMPALHIASTPPRNPPHLLAEWLPGVISGWTVGAGHFNMIEAPIQVNDMVERFVDQHAGGPVRPA
ncbi:MAG: alpha/beta fold hydrolase [Candidatus Dormibacteraceae bacterium]